MFYRSILGLAVALGVAAGLSSGPARAAGSVSPAPMTWTTLGTAGGPVVQADRSQPANLLEIGKRNWLVDCGDGAVERLGAAGYQPPQVSAVFVSHLHLDHIGGLQGLLGLRWMQGASSAITVYGPAGIDTVVAAIVQSLQASARIGMAVRGAKAGSSPAELVKVVTLTDGSDLAVDGVRVRTARNSHFDETPGHPADTGTESLSYRFDLEGYAVGYTGDTGASTAVDTLFKGTDLVVSEVIDLPRVIENINGPNSPIPAPMRPGLILHLQAQHLTPQQAGAMAAAAGAPHLVLTHLGIVGPTGRAAPTLLAGAQETFRGKVSVAHDLEKF